MTDTQISLTTTASSDDPPSPISLLPDDLLLLKILSLVLSTADPRQLPRLSSVSRRFSRLLSSLLPPSLPLPLPPSLSVPYPTLHKLAVCCPGLLHTGVVIAHFAWDCDFSDHPANSVAVTVTSTPTDSLFNNLSETLDNAAHDTDSDNLTLSETESETVPADTNIGDCDSSSSNQPQNFTDTLSHKIKMMPFWKEKSTGPTGSHLASGNWSLSRKQGMYLLASEFSNDSLYICDWPGCVHWVKNRLYKLFRGVFEDFKKSRVWEKIMDSKLVKITLDCVYCTCNEMWDLRLAGCLSDNYMKFHGDGEPFIRAFVCDNGHVSGEWTGRLDRWFTTKISLREWDIIRESKM